MRRQRRLHRSPRGLAALRIQCRDLVSSPMASSLPSVACFALFACILGVDIYTRRMCATDRQVVQAPASSAPSKVVEAAMNAPATAESSPSLSGPEHGIEFHVHQRDLAVHYDCEPLAPVVYDIQLDVDLIRHGSDSTDETSGGR